jgi:hypothetical protein
MLTITKRQAAESLLLELLSEKHHIADKILFFERKYQTEFETFEKRVTERDEDFQIWDDYMEWKAYKNMFTDVLKKIDSIKNEDFAIN